MQSTTARTIATVRGRTVHSAGAIQRSWGSQFAAAAMQSIAPRPATAATTSAAVRCFASHSSTPKSPHAQTASRPSATPIRPPPSPAASAPRPAAAAAAPTRAAALPTFNAIMKQFNLLIHPDLFTSSPVQAKINQESLQALNALLANLKTKEATDPYPPKQILQLLFYLKKRRGDEKWAEYIKKYDLKMHLEGKANKSTASNQARKSNGGVFKNTRNSAAAAASTTAVIPPRGTHVLENEFHLVPVLISTNGGHCKKSVSEQFSSLFYRMGLPIKWRWDAEYWNMGAAKEYKAGTTDEPMEDDFDEDDEAQDGYDSSRR